MHASARTYTRSTCDAPLSLGVKRAVPRTEPDTPRREIVHDLHVLHLEAAQHRRRPAAARAIAVVFHFHPLEQQALDDHGVPDGGHGVVAAQLGQRQPGAAGEVEGDRRQLVVRARGARAGDLEAEVEPRPRLQVAGPLVRRRGGDERRQHRRVERVRQLRVRRPGVHQHPAVALRVDAAQAGRCGHGGAAVVVSEDDTLQADVVEVRVRGARQHRGEDEAAVRRRRRQREVAHHQRAGEVGVPREPEAEEAVGEALAEEPELGRQGQGAPAEPGDAERLPDGAAHAAEAEAREGHGERAGAGAAAVCASMERHGVPGEGAEDQCSAAVGVGERRARSGALAAREGRDGAPRRRARVEPVVGAVDVDAEAAPAEVPRVRRGF